MLVNLRRERFSVPDDKTNDYVSAKNLNEAMSHLQPYWGQKIAVSRRLFER